MKRAASDTSEATDPSWDFIGKILFDEKGSPEQHTAFSSNQTSALDEC